MADIGIRIGVQGASQAQSSIRAVAGSLSTLDDATLKVGNAFRGLGPTIAAAFSVGAVTAWVRDAINAADAAGKLAQGAGLAVEQVAGLQLAFRQSGLAAEQLAPAMTKLSTAIVNGNDALKALGINTRAADGSLRSTRDVLGEVAQRFSTYQDGAAKTALAVKLFGDELGARLVPLLNSGAQGLADFDDKARRLGLTIGTEAAANAARFNDQLDLFKARLQGAATTIGVSVLPAFTALLESVDGAIRNTDSLANDNSMARWAETAALGLAVTAESLVGIVKLAGTVGGAFRAVAADIELLGTIASRTLGAPLSGGILNPENREAIRQALTERNQIVEEFNRKLDELWNYDGTAISRRLRERLGAGGANGTTPGGAAPGTGVAPTLGNTTNDAFGDFALRQLAAQRQREIDAAIKAVQAYNLALQKAEEERIAGLDREAAASRAFAESVIRDRNAAAAASADSAAAQLQTLQEEEQALALAEARNISLAQAIQLVTIARLEEQQAALPLGGADPRLDALQREIDARKELATLLGTRAARDANREAAAAAGRDWEQITAQIGQSLTDALMSGSMKAGDFIKNLFRTMVLRPVIQAVMNPVMGAIGTATGLAGTANAATGGSGGGMGGLSLISTGLQMAGAYGGLAGAGAAMTLAGNTGMALSAASAAMSAGSVGAGLSIGIGAIAPYALAAVAVISLLRRRLKDAGIEGTFGPDGFTGNQFKDWSGGLFTSAKTNRTALDEDTSTALSRTFRDIRTSTREMAADLGIGAQAIDSFTKTIRISTKGLNEQQVQEAFGRQFEAITEELAALALGTTTEIVEMVEVTRSVMRGMGDDMNMVTETVLEEQRRVIEGAGAYVLREGETAAQALQRLSGAISAVNPMLDVLGQRMFDVSVQGADFASQLADLFGGNDAFTQVAGQFYQAFYTEAERAATTTRLLTTELAGLGLALPATREEFRALVEAQDLTTESGRATYAALLQMSGAFATISPELDATTEALDNTADALRRAADIANERAGLERQLLDLQGDTAAIRALERAALDESNRALYDQITALQDSQAAAQAAAQAEADLAAERERIAQERAGLERQLLDLQGDTAAIRALERAALDESNRALYDQITALQDTQAAAQAAADAERALSDARANAARDFAAAQQRLAQEAASATDVAFALVRRAIEAEAEAARAALTASFEAQIQSIERQQQTATAARDAASETLRTATDIFDLLGNEVASLRGTVGAGMSAAAGQRFIADAITAARATGTLPERQALAEAVAAARGALEPASFGNAFEQRRATLLLANSLDDLQQAAGSQISTAEAALRVAEDQLATLQTSAADARSLYEQQIEATRTTAADQLAAAQAQLDALRGIDARILTVADALVELGAAVAAEGAARAAAASAAASAASVTQSGRSVEQLAQMLPADWNNRGEAEKIGWFNANQISVAELTSAGVTWDEVDYMLRNGYRGFANGGLHTGGLRLVGERGPELEVTGPARYWSFEQTSEMLNDRQRREELLAGEIRELRTENAAQARAMVAMQTRMNRLLERWDADGLPEERVV